MKKSTNARSSRCSGPLGLQEKLDGIFPRIVMNGNIVEVENAVSIREYYPEGELQILRIM